MRSLCLVPAELLFAQEGLPVLVLPSRALLCKLPTGSLRDLAHVLPFHGKPGSVSQSGKEQERGEDRPYVDVHGSLSFAHAALIIRQFLANIPTLQHVACRAEGCRCVRVGSLGFVPR